MITSTAHDFVQRLPLEPFALVCVRCGQPDNGERCVEHYESDTSGYLPEAPARQ